MKYSFPATCDLVIKSIEKKPLFYLTYLLIHSAFYYSFYLFIYFFLHFEVFYILEFGSFVIILFGIFLFLFCYTRINVWAMTELKTSLKDPSHQLSFTHWNRYPILWGGTTLYMSIYMGLTFLLGICLFVPYFVYTTFYFFQPVVIALYPNETTIAYHEKVIETVIQSKGIRGYLAFFNIATMLITACLVLAVFYLNMNSFLSIGLITIILSLNPIFKYTVGTLYFYQNWESIE